MDESQDEGKVIQLRPKEQQPKGKGKQPARKPAAPASTRNPDEPKLTGKQERFAFLVGAEGLSYSAAYREAYDAAGMSDKALWNEASALGKHPGVAMAIDKHRAANEARAYRDGDFVRRKIIDGLLKEAEQAEQSKDRLKAYELLGKLEHVGAFKERSEVSRPRDEMSADELQAALEERLRKLVG